MTPFILRREGECDEGRETIELKIFHQRPVEVGRGPRTEGADCSFELKDGP